MCAPATLHLELSARGGTSAGVIGIPAVGMCAVWLHARECYCSLFVTYSHDRMAVSVTVV
jgi:hypothetical protein